MTEVLNDDGKDAAVLFERQGDIAVITLNRPGQRNAVNGALAIGLHNAVKAFEAEPALRVAILAGAGKVFCAGMDLTSFAQSEVDDVLQGEGRFAGFVALERSKPIIAAVQGAALAGGMEIMLACDMVIAERSAKFGLPEARIGLFAGGGGVFRLAQRMPPCKATEYVVTGATFSAQEAERYGLLNRVVDDGGAMDAALELAREVARSAPRSVEQSLRLLRLSGHESEERLWPLNDTMLADILASDDAQEGVRSFREKRAPDWAGT